jgi:xanthine/CO dehydrogenase XdhC/CoxF family maturation factor
MTPLDLRHDARPAARQEPTTLVDHRRRSGASGRRCSWSRTDRRSARSGIRARPDRGTRCARGARGGSVGHPPLRPPRRDDARGPRARADRSRRSSRAGRRRRRCGSSVRSTSPRRSRASPRSSGTGSSCATRARSSRPAAASRLRTRWSSRGRPAVRARGHELSGRDAVCILTHDAKFDVPAVQGAVATRVGYIGVMGSRKTHDAPARAPPRGRRVRREIERLMSPIGPGPRRAHARGDGDLDLRRDHRTAHRPRCPSLRDTAGAIHS